MNESYSAKIIPMVLEIKGPGNGKWVHFPILTVKNHSFKGGLKTFISPGMVIEMRFVNLTGDFEDFSGNKFYSRINSIRHLKDSGYYLIHGEVVKGQDVWERLSGELLR